MNDMIDMSRFIEAKSDQLNADDLIGTTRTITVTRVVGCDGDQPIAIHYEGDNGKPFKPCKTIRRVLMAIWGKYANEYVGKSMTVYRDDRVMFGGLEVGGIRVSHMSHLDKETVVVVMKSKGKKAGMKILPLAAGKASGAPAVKTRQTPDEWAQHHIAALKAAQSADALATLRAKGAKALARLQTERPDLYALIIAADPASGPDTDDDPFGLPPLTETHDPRTGEVLTGPAEAEADILAHLARKTTVIDVDSLIKDRLGELDEDAQDRVREAAMLKIDEIKAQ